MLDIRRANVSHHIGISVFIIGFVLFLVGFSCPFWTKVTGPPELKIGLWLTCSVQRHCRAISSISFVFGGWWLAVQSFQCVSLALWAVATGLWLIPALGVKPPCLYQNTVSPSGPVCRRHPRHRRLLIATAALAGCANLMYVGTGFGSDINKSSDQFSVAAIGMCGIVGDVVFVAKLTTTHAVPDTMNLSWAFVINAVGCLFAVIASVILVVPCHSQPENPTSADPVSNVAAAVAGEDEVSSSSTTKEGEVTPQPFRIVVPDELSHYMWSREQISTRF